MNKVKIKPVVQYNVVMWSIYNLHNEQLIDEHDSKHDALIHCKRNNYNVVELITEQKIDEGTGE